MSTRRFTDITDPATDRVIGPYATSKVAFHGATATSMRSSSKLTAGISFLSITGASWVANTASTLSGLFGFSSTEISGLYDLLIEVRAMLVEKGLHKGGA